MRRSSDSGSPEILGQNCGSEVGKLDFRTSKYLFYMDLILKKSRCLSNVDVAQVENLEDKVASASMQVKGWKVPNRNNPGDGEESASKRPKLEPVELAKQRLIALESAIERRYLKPPLGFSTGEGGIGIQADQDESIPKGSFRGRG